VLAVAPPGRDFAGPEAAGAVRAFLLEPLDSLVLHRGTWHWGPFPVHHDEVRLFNVQGLGYLRDNACVDLVATGAAVDVLFG
jgi:hypothetical protein